MEQSDNLIGLLARLPDGQLVRIEEVHSDGYATVRRLEGERRGKIALCAVSKLDRPDTFFVSVDLNFKLE